MTAFKRSTAMFAAIKALATSGLSGLNLPLAIQGLGAYTSRGHGGKHKAHGKHTKCLKKMLNQRSRYRPHQGVREIARRAQRLTATN